MQNVDYTTGNRLVRKQMLAPDFKSKDGSRDTPCFLLHKMKGYGIILVSLFSNE